MHRFSVFVLGLFLLSINASGQVTTTTTSMAPATIVSDASGNLLLIERRAANSVPGAATTASGLVTRIVVVPPQSGSAPSTSIYPGTIGALYIGKRALYTVLTATERGRTTRSLVAIDGGVNGVLLPTLPTVALSISGSLDVRVATTTTGNQDTIYIVQQRSSLRRTTGIPGLMNNPPISPTRTITIVDFDGVRFSAPRTVAVQ